MLLLRVIACKRHLDMRFQGRTAPKSWMHWMQAVKKEVDEAVEKAKKGTIPKADMLWKNIYAETLGGVMRGMDSQTKIKL